MKKHHRHLIHSGTIALLLMVLLYLCYSTTIGLKLIISWYNLNNDMPISYTTLNGSIAQKYFRMDDFSLQIGEQHLNISEISSKFSLSLFSEQRLYFEQIRAYQIQVHDKKKTIAPNSNEALFAASGYYNWKTETPTFHVDASWSKFGYAESGGIILDGSLDKYHYQIEFIDNKNKDYLAGKVVGEGNRENTAFLGDGIYLLEGKSHIQGRIAWNDAIRWKISLSGQDIQTHIIEENYQGKINTTLTWTGHKTDDQENWSLQIDQLSGVVNQGEVNGQGALHSNNGILTAKDFVLKVGNNTLTIDGNCDANCAVNFNAKLNKVQQVAPGLRGKFYIDGKLTGTLSNPLINGTLSSKRLTIDNLWRITSTSEFNLKVESSTEDARNWIYNMTINEGSLTNIANDSLGVTFPYQSGKLSIFKTAETLSTAFSIHGAHDTDIDLGIEQQIVPGKAIWSQPSKGHLTMSMNKIDVLMLLIPEATESKGHGKANLAWDFTKGKSNVDGQFALEEVELRLAKYGVHLKDSQLLAKAKNNVINWSGSLSSGPGKVAITGQSKLNNRAESQIQVVGENFTVQSTAEATIRISPDIKIGYFTDHFTLDGDIHVPFARIEPRDFVSAVTNSSDVVYVDNTEPQKTAFNQIPFQLKVNMTLNEQDIYFKGFNLETNIGGNLSIQKGRKDPVATANGRLNISNGKYSLYDEALSINHGRLIYNKALLTNPSLDIKAERVILIKEEASSVSLSELNNNTSNTSTNNNNNTSTSQSTTEGIVGVAITGTIHKPQYAFYSTPWLPESDQLSYLVLGVSSQNTSDAQGRILLQAFKDFAGGLGGTKKQNLVSQLEKITSIDSIGLVQTDYVDETTGETKEQSALKVGKKFGSRLYVDYTIGLINPINIIQVQYKLTDRIRLRTETSSIGNSGGDIFYSSE